MPAWIVPAITAVAGVVANVLNQRREKRNYRAQQRYNSPKNQMKRYSEAGLSPYLIYSQGNSGNMSSPLQQSPTDFHADEAIESYMSIEQFNKQQKQLDQAIRAAQLSNQLNERLLNYKVNRMSIGTKLDDLKLMSSIIETKANNPGLSTLYDDLFSGDLEGIVSNSFVSKMNELKVAISMKEKEKIEKLLEGMDFDNVVKRVKAHYADDYGMVGGDWTQGLGLLKSLGGMFRRSKVVPNVKGNTRRVTNKGYFNYGKEF